MNISPSIHIQIVGLCVIHSDTCWLCYLIRGRCQTSPCKPMAASCKVTGSTITYGVRTQGPQDPFEPHPCVIPARCALGLAW